MLKNAHLRANGAIDNPLAVSVDHALPLRPPTTPPPRLRQAMMRQHCNAPLFLDNSPNLAVNAKLTSTHHGSRIISKSKSVEKTIERFLLRRKKPFDLWDLLSHLESKDFRITSKIESEVRSALENSTLIFSDETDGYIPRRTWFSGAKFMICPTGKEINSDILIPGHRFMPFCSSEIFPWDSTLVAAEGRKIGKKKIKGKIKDFLIYFTFFGLENIPAILLADSEENEEAVLEGTPESEVAITVFSMKEIYADYEFREGDGLMLTVQNWSKGRFSVEHISRDKRKKNPEAELEWVRQLESGFDTAFDSLGLFAEMQEQIAHAFYYAGRELLEDPVIHLGGFLEKAGFLEFKKLGNETHLWRTDEDMEEQYMSSFELEPTTGASSSLETILDDINLSLSSEDIEAYMRNELFHRGNSLKAVLERCFSGRQTNFFDREQESTFHRLVDLLWERVKEQYNLFADQAGGKLREKALKVFDSHISWMRSLDRMGVDLNNLPGDKLIASFQAAAKVSMLLDVLNRKVNIPAKHASTLHKVLDGVEKTIAAYQEQIADSMKRE